jgi:hypothetical protein
LGSVVFAGASGTYHKKIMTDRKIIQEVEKFILQLTGPLGRLVLFSDTASY